MFKFAARALAMVHVGWHKRCVGLEQLTWF